MRATLTAIVLAGLCAGVCVAAEPVSPTADVIAVATNANGGRDTEIALVTHDGTVLRFLTQNALQRVRSELVAGSAPDRVRARRRPARGHPRHRRRQPLGAAANAWNDDAPAFSPDGKYVAFARGSSIRITDADTRAQRLLVRTRWAPRQLSWSPDGRSILFGDGGYVRLLDVATRSVTTLPVGGGDSNFRPVFAPDGRTIAFLGNRDERYFREWDAWGIFLANADGSNVRKGHTGKYGPTSWSPDGTRLAVQYGHEISVVDIAAGGRTVLLLRGRNDHAAFRP